MQQTAEQYDREREDLEALVQSPGWARFIAHLNDEWGAAAYARKIEQAVASIPSSAHAGEQARETVFQITGIRKAMQTITKWPLERLERVRELTRTGTGLVKQ
jgi:hypothetical protein